MFNQLLPTTNPRVIRRITTGPNARDVIRKCYDFALSHCAQDKDAYDIWQDYINFLKAGEVSFRLQSFKSRRRPWWRMGVLSVLVYGRMGSHPLRDWSMPSSDELWRL